MATINTALHFGLKNKGAIAPGRDADLVVLDDLENVNVKSVWVAGKQIAEHGRMLTDEPDSHTLAATGNTVTDLGLFDVNQLIHVEIDPEKN